LILIGCLLGLLWVPGAAQSREQACTQGASSIRATIVDGRVEVSKPVVTGCVP
jgi:hypothetical protein